MSLKSETVESNEEIERRHTNPKKRRKILGDESPKKASVPERKKSKKVVKYLFKKEAKSSSQRTDTSSNSSQSHDEPSQSSDNATSKKLRKIESPFSSIPAPRLTTPKRTDCDEDEKFDSDTDDSSELSIRGFTDDDDDDSDLSDNDDTLDYFTLPPPNTNRNMPTERKRTNESLRNASRWGRMDSPPTTNSAPRPGLGRGFAFPRPPPLDLNRHPFFDRRNDAPASQDLASILGFPFTARSTNDSDSDTEGVNRPPSRHNIGRLLPPGFWRRLVFGFGMPRDPLSPTAGDGGLWEMNDNGIPPAPERDSQWISGLPFPHRIGFGGSFLPFMFMPDPDNMSYEELLELGERIGTVKLVFSEEVINKHSTTKTLDEDEIEVLKRNDTLDCKICIEDFELGNNIRILRCGHKFHKEDCIDRWLKDSKLCPVCRQEVAESPSEDDKEL